MLKIINLKKEFKKKEILEGINLELSSTGLVILTGQNGSGKSTLINIIGGLDIPSSGSIEIDGKKLSNKERDLCRYREEFISYIFQENNLFDNLTVEENVNIIGKSKNYEKIIKTLKLESLLDKKIKDLSGGEKQRVAIARAITKDSKIILADEPTASIDADSKDIILNLLKELSKNRLVILISHDKIEIPDFEDVILHLENSHISVVKKHDLDYTKFADNVDKKKNNFNIIKFAKKNFTVDKKKTVRNSILLMITFLLLLLVISISQLDFNAIHANTLKLEKDNLFLITQINNIKNDFNLDDLKYLKKHLNLKNLELGYSIEENQRSINFECSICNRVNNIFFFNEEYITPDYGRKPNLDDEIIVSSYLADLIIDSENNSNSNNKINYEDLVNSYLIKLGNHQVRIVGIYNVNVPHLQELNEKDIYQRNIIDEIINNKANNVYVKDGFFNIYNDIPKEIDYDKYVFPYKEFQPNQTSFGGYDEHSFKIFKDQVELTDGSIIEIIENNEIIINTDVLDYWNFKINDCIGKEVEFNIGDKNLNNVGKIKGIIKGVSKDNNIYIHQDNVPTFLINNNKIRKVMFYADDEDNVQNLMEKFPISLDENTYTFQTSYSKEFKNIEYNCNVIIKLSKIVIVILLIISMLFLYNYIKSNIELHKKELAILKSFGITNYKIMYMFMYQVIKVTSTAFIYALLTYIIIRFIINLTVSHMVSFKINIIPIHISLMLLIYFSSLFLDYIICLLTFNKIKRIYPQKLLKKML